MQTKMTVSLKYQKDIGRDVIEVKTADSMNSIILLTGFIDKVASLVDDPALLKKL